METVVEDARENAVNTIMEMEHKANVGKLVEENGINHLEIETSKQIVHENRQNRIKGFVSNFFDKHLSSEETKEAFICSNCSGKSKTEEIVKTMVDKSISTDDVDEEPMETEDESEETTEKEVKQKPENSFKFRFQFFTK